MNRDLVMFLHSFVSLNLSRVCIFRNMTIPIRSETVWNSDMKSLRLAGYEAKKRCSLSGGKATSFGLNSPRGVLLPWRNSLSREHKGARREWGDGRKYWHKEIEQWTWYMVDRWIDWLFALIFVAAPMGNLLHGRRTSVATDQTYGRGCHSMSRKTRRWKQTRRPSSSPSLKEETHLLKLLSKSSTRSRRWLRPSPAPPLNHPCRPSASMQRRQGVFREETPERRRSLCPLMCLTLLGPEEEVATTTRVLVWWTVGILVSSAWVTSA